MSKPKSYADNAYEAPAYSYQNGSENGHLATYHDADVFGHEENHQVKFPYYIQNSTSSTLHFTTSRIHVPARHVSD